MDSGNPPQDSNRDDALHLPSSAAASVSVLTYLAAMEKRLMTHIDKIFEEVEMRLSARRSTIGTLPKKCDSFNHPPSLRGDSMGLTMKENTQQLPPISTRVQPQSTPETTSSIKSEKNRGLIRQTTPAPFDQHLPTPADSRPTADLQENKSRPTANQQPVDAPPPMSSRGEPLDIPDNDLDAEMRLMAAKAAETFRMMDTDGSGTIDMEEVSVLLKTLGFDSQNAIETIREALRQADKDGNGTVDIKEFVEMMTMSSASTKSMSEGEEPEKAGHLKSMVQRKNVFGFITQELMQEHRRRVEHQIVGNSKHLVDPRDAVSHHWDAFVALFLMITVISLPLSLAFESIFARFYHFNLVTDFVFLADVIKHFNTGYVDTYGFAVMDRTKISYNYLTTWFLVDLVSCIPVDLMVKGGSMANFSKIPKLLRLARASKMIRVLQLQKVFGFFAEIKAYIEDRFHATVSDNFADFLKIIFIYFVTMHWVACINWAVAATYDFQPDSWVGHADLEVASVRRQYRWSMYKALTQFVGLSFGGADEAPVTNTVCATTEEYCAAEHWTSLTCTYLGSAYGAVLVSNVITIVASIYRAKAELQDTISRVNQYLSAKRIPLTMREKVRAFYQMQFQEGRMWNEGEILSTLTPSLRQDILTYNQRNLRDAVPLLERAPADFFRRLSEVLTAEVSFEGDTVFREGTVGKRMYFISSGIVDIVSQHLENPLKSISTGCYFGDVALLMSVRRTASAIVKVPTMLYYVEDESLHDILDDHPRIHEYMLFIARERKIRVDCVDPGHTMQAEQLSRRNMVDREDSSTRFFSKISGHHQEVHFTQVVDESRRVSMVKKKHNVFGSARNLWMHDPSLTTLGHSARVFEQELVSGVRELEKEVVDGMVGLERSVSRRFFHHDQESMEESPLRQERTGRSRGTIELEPAVVKSSGGIVER